MLERLPNVQLYSELSSVRIDVIHVVDEIIPIPWRLQVGVIVIYHDIVVVGRLVKWQFDAHGLAEHVHDSMHPVNAGPSIEPFLLFLR